MGINLQIAHNAVVAKLIGADQAARDIVADMLTYLEEGHQFTQAFMNAGWDGRSSLFARATDSFPAGFVHAVQQGLTQAGYSVSLIRKPALEPLGPFSPIVDEFGNDDPRYDFQLKALRQVEKHQRGIIQVATGGGKSKIAKLIVARYRRPALFLTTRGVLMHQMADGFRGAQLTVGMLGDGEWSPRSGVNVGMVQTLVERLKDPHVSGEMRDLIEAATKRGEKIVKAEIKKIAEEKVRVKSANRAKTIKFLEMMEIIIGEEAHEAGGDSYYEILKHCKNASIRVALTATPFMKDSAESNMRLMGAFGPVLIRVSEKLLIDRGVLAKPYFRYAHYKPHEKLRRSSPWPRAYQLGLMECDGRNNLAIEHAVKASKRGMTSMILVQRKSHGVAIREALVERGLRAVFIQGENNEKERRKALAALEAGEIDALIGTNILDVGVDVPAVGTIVLLGGGKEQVALRQRVGRGLRAKKKGPNVAFILDFMDFGNDHLRDHYRQRRAIIEATPGFAENILPDNTDFDWEMFERV